jgi:hypothetical protein
MNYQKIHDDIIHQARHRILCDNIYVENHHIIPKCEGGLDFQETVKLTIKEHRLVHLLRYKMTKIVGNLIASNLMSNTSESIKKSRHIFAKIGAKAYHEKYKDKFFKEYSNHQRVAGTSGGNKCKEQSLGFFSLSSEEMKKAQDRGRQTIVKNKLGMFSDEYRENHKILLHKKIKTPEGIFNSMKEAAKHYNIVPGTITYRVKNKNWNDWCYMNEKGECNG